MNDELKTNGYNTGGAKRRGKMRFDAWYLAQGPWCVTLNTGAIGGSGGLTIEAYAERLATAERRAVAKLQRVLRREAGKLLAMADRLGGKR